MFRRKCCAAHLVVAGVPRASRRAGCMTEPVHSEFAASGSRAPISGPLLVLRASNSRFPRGPRWYRTMLGGLASNPRFDGLLCALNIHSSTSQIAPLPRLPCPSAGRHRTGHRTPSRPRNTTVLSLPYLFVAVSENLVWKTAAQSGCEFGTPVALVSGHHPRRRRRSVVEGGVASVRGIGRRQTGERAREAYTHDT